MFIVTQQFLDYLADQPLVIEVWRTKQVKVHNDPPEATETKMKEKNEREEDTKSQKSVAFSFSSNVHVGVHADVTLASSSTKEVMAKELKRRGSAVAITRGSNDMVS